MTVAIGGMPAATILDGAGMVNVPTFGMCSNLGNPAVAAVLHQVQMIRTMP